MILFWFYLCGLSKTDYKKKIWTGAWSQSNQWTEKVLARMDIWTDWHGHSLFTFDMLIIISCWSCFDHLNTPEKKNTRAITCFASLSSTCMCFTSYLLSFSYGIDKQTKTCNIFWFSTKKTFHPNCGRQFEWNIVLIVCVKNNENI